MIVWHVCSITQLKRYESHGKILPPVRAWRNINAAERFSKQTARGIILRLKFFKPLPLEGHGGEAVYQDSPYLFDWIVNRSRVGNEV